MVVNDHVEHLRGKCRHRTQRIEAILRMLLHHSQFIGIEGTRLFEDSERNACLSDVVEHSRER